MRCRLSRFKFSLQAHWRDDWSSASRALLRHQSLLRLLNTITLQRIKNRFLTICLWHSSLSCSQSWEGRSIFMLKQSGQILRQFRLLHWGWHVRWIRSTFSSLFLSGAHCIYKRRWFFLDFQWQSMLRRGRASSFRYFFSFKNALSLDHSLF